MKNNKNYINSNIISKNSNHLQPLGCKNSFLFFTKWYNLLLYIIIFYTLVFNDYKIIRSYLIFTVPIFTIGEFYGWKTKFYKKCGYTFKDAIIKSIVFHLLPLILFIYSNNYKYNNNFDYTGFYIGFILGLFYVIKYNFEIKKIYGIENLNKVLFICLISVYLTMRFIIRK